MVRYSDEKVIAMTYLEWVDLKERPMAFPDLDLEDWEIQDIVVRKKASEQTAAAVAAAVVVGGTALQTGDLVLWLAGGHVCLPYPDPGFPTVKWTQVQETVLNLNNSEIKTKLYQYYKIIEQTTAKQPQFQLFR